MPTVELSDETYEKIKDQITQDPLPNDPDLKTRIVCVDNRGLTFVGKTTLKADNNGWVIIYKAQCIVYWGTTKHIAELAKGPTSKTRLGETRTVRVRLNNIQFVYDCNFGAWNV